MSKSIEISPETLASVSPGIRDLVIKLNDLGFRSTDSGDGSNHAAGMECAMPFRHVVGVFGPEGRADLIAASLDLQGWFPDAYIEVGYSPSDDFATWMLCPDGVPKWGDEVNHDG